jgi:hypothetical protein
VLVKLLPSTKSSQKKQLDLVLAYEYAGHIKLGSQLELLFSVMDELGWQDGPLPRHENGTPWTSAHFWGVHLIPLLKHQTPNGNKILQQCIRLDKGGLPLTQRLYSMHSYRWGG